MTHYVTVLVENSSLLTLFGVGNIIYFVYLCVIKSDFRAKNKEVNMGYLSISQTAKKWGITARRIQRLCADGRIPGATKIGSYWAVPADAKKPRDERIKSRNYIKRDSAK